MTEMIMATMGEMSLKGLNRKSFENTLLKTLRKRSEGLGQWEVTTSQSAIYITPQDEEAINSTDEMYARCGKTFGIAALVRCACCEKDINAIAETAKEYLAAELAAAKTFKVGGKRADKKFPLNSIEIGREVGALLLQACPHLKVDVKAPELLVVVEIREGSAYVHAPKEKGAGGLPVPSSGRAAMLLSGGIDSPVAAWQMAKRGLGLVAVHFASPPYTSPRASAKVEALAQILTDWTGPLPYYLVPYTKTQEYLRDNLQKQNYFTVIMRRSMLRITEVISAKEQCDAIITGESLAQVASQTLQALACTDAAQSLPILRPCIGLDKIEITEIARKIGTFETSIQPYEDCCTIFNPPHPKTKPRLEDIEYLEAAMPQLAQLEAEAAAEAEFKLLVPEG